MEKADQNLLDYMKSRSKIGYEVYAPQFRGLSEALAELHKYAIHRDIKPENILIQGETWLIGDLGLCSYLSEEEHLDLTSDNEKIGPKFWLSPEAINRVYFGVEEICPCSDVYQLCAVFWFVITYRHPQGIITESDSQDVDPNICRILVKSLSYDINMRPQNGRELFELMSGATEYR
jgi:serine/threonine-protein kinase